MTTDARNGKAANDESATLHARIADLERQLEVQAQVEQALRMQVELYAQTLDTLPDMVIVKGPRSQMLYANKALRDCYDMTLAQLQDMIDAPFVEPDYTQKYIQDDQYVFTTGKPLKIVESIMRHDGQVLPVETIKLPVFDETNQVIRMVAIIHDISEQEQLRVELDRFFNLSLDMLCVAGTDGYFKRLNPTWSATLGFTEAELYAEPFLSLVHPDDQAMTIAATQQLAAGHEVIAFENRYRCKDGSYKWIEWKSTAFPEQQLIYAVARDITERKRVEQELGESERRLKQFLDGLPVGVFVVEPDGKPFYANLTARRLLGKGIVPTAAIDDLSEVYSAFIAGTDQPYPVERMPLVRALQGERSTISDMEIHLPGQTILIEVAGMPILDSNGTITYALTAFTDITQRKQAEDALRQSIAQEEVIRAQAAALRELSTPLIPISEQVMVMPLIGTVDSHRTQQVMDTLLQGIAETQALVTIIDITGVPVVDSQVANALIQAARAVRLLGAQVILTGIRPEVAQTLVGLGVDLSGIITRGSLQSGITFALQQQQQTL